MSDMTKLLYIFLHVCWLGIAIKSNKLCIFNSYENLYFVVKHRCCIVKYKEKHNYTLFFK